MHVPQYLCIQLNPSSPGVLCVIALGQPHETSKTKVGGVWPLPFLSQAVDRQWTGNARGAAASQTRKKICGHGANPQDKECETPAKYSHTPHWPPCWFGHWPLITSHLPATLHCRALTGGLVPLRREQHFHGNKVIPSTPSCPLQGK